MGWVILSLVTRLKIKLQKYRNLLCAFAVITGGLWAWNTFSWMLQPQPGVLVEVPTESITERSAIIHWAPLPAYADKIADYNIYVSGWFAGRYSELTPAVVKRCYVAPAEHGPDTLSLAPQYYWRATGLQTNTYYMMEVEPILKDGSCLARTYFEAPTPPQGDEINVQMYYAWGYDGIVDTHSLQCALADVKEGGRVVVPYGHYLSGPLLLCGNFTLELQEGAVLEQVAGEPAAPPLGGWPDGNPPKTTAFLNLAGGSNVRIVGRGKIVGGKASAASGQTALLQFKNQNDIYIGDVTLEAGGLKALEFINCSDVLLDGVRIIE